MKNKSKKKKIKEKRIRTKSSWPKEWLYLNENDIEPKDFTNVLEGLEGFDIQVWQEAGVVEAELPCGRSIDLEWGEVDFSEEEAQVLFDGRRIGSVYYVTVVSDAQEEAQKAMQEIVTQMDGGFFADNEAGMPRICKENSAKSQ